MPYWVLVIAPNGRPFLRNVSYINEARAEEALEHEEGLGHTAKVFRTESSNKAEATREIRAQIKESPALNNSWGRNFKHKEVVHE